MFFCSSKRVTTVFLVSFLADVHVGWFLLASLMLTVYNRFDFTLESAFVFFRIIILAFFHFTTVISSVL